MGLHCFVPARNMFLCDTNALEGKNISIILTIQSAVQFSILILMILYAFQPIILLLNLLQNKVKELMQT